MEKYFIKVIVKLKNTVKDAKGEAVGAVLKRMGLEESSNMRLGKIFEFEINAEDEKDARERLNKICENVLVNPVVETYEVFYFEKDGCKNVCV